MDEKVDLLKTGVKIESNFHLERPIIYQINGILMRIKMQLSEL